METNENVAIWRGKFNADPCTCPICEYSEPKYYTSGDKIGQLVEHYSRKTNMQQHIVEVHANHKLWRKGHPDYKDLVARIGPRKGQKFPRKRALAQYYIDGFMDGLFRPIN